MTIVNMRGGGGRGVHRGFYCSTAACRRAPPCERHEVPKCDAILVRDHQSSVSRRVSQSIDAHGEHSRQRRERQWSIVRPHLCLLKRPFLLLRLMLQQIVDTLLDDDIRPPLTAPDSARE